MAKKSDLVQVSPKEWIRRNPGESDTSVRQRWAQGEAEYASQQRKANRTLERQEILDRMVMTPSAANKKWGNKIISSSGTGYGSTRD